VPLRTTSAAVVSSTNFHFETSRMSRSFIIRMNSQGPSLVPWGIPEGTSPHSERQSLDNFTLCFRSIKKSIVQRVTAHGMVKLDIFSANKAWSIRSKAFCNRTGWPWQRSQFHLSLESIHG
jgi:hypothetical protein